MAHQYQFSIIEPQSNDLSFDDEYISIKFNLPQKRVGAIFFELKNLTDNSIKILWDNMIFLDTEGESHKIVHGEVKVIHTDLSHPPTIILPNSYISDMIVPLKQGRGYTFLPPIDFFSPTDSELEAKTYIGSTFGILFSLEMKNEIKQYFFRFKVDKI